MSAYDDKAVAAQVEQALAFDPLAAAERAFGERWQDSEAVQALGMLGHMAHGENKEALLLANGDTLLSNATGRYESILRAEGFAEVYVEPFMSKGYGDALTVEEKFAIWWHPRDGLLLAFNTFGGRDHHVNSGNVYYNWRPTSESYWHATSSGGPMREDGIWPGDHDCREALRFNLHRLRSLGEFVCPWVQRPWMWLSHHGDAEKGRHEERLERLPADVLAAITPATKVKP